MLSNIKIRPFRAVFCGILLFGIANITDCLAVNIFSPNIYCGGASGSGTTPTQATTVNTGDVMIQAICDNNTSTRGTQCIAIPSSADAPDGYGTVFVCTDYSAVPGGYCLTDSDCSILGKGKCLVATGSYSLFVQPGTNGVASNTASAYTVGVCGALGGSTEDNAFGEAICNLISVVTGTAGRGFVAVCVIVVGIMFFMGKISWSTVLAIALGSGAMFGAPTMVKVVTGQSFKCKK